MWLGNGGIIALGQSGGFAGASVTLTQCKSPPFTLLAQANIIHHFVDM